MSIEQPPACGDRSTGLDPIGTGYAGTNSFRYCSMHNSIDLVETRASPLSMLPHEDLRIRPAECLMH